MDKSFTFWFPVTLIRQSSFLDQDIQVEKMEEGHIVHSGVLMCGESREKILNSFKTKKSAVHKTRPQLARICPKCQRAYKHNLDSAWYEWEIGKPKKYVAPLPPLNKF